MGHAAGLDDSTGLAPRENSCLLIKLGPFSRDGALAAHSRIRAAFGCLECPCEPRDFGSWGADVPVLGHRVTSLSLLLGAKGVSDMESRDVSDHLSKARIRCLFCSCPLPSFYLVGLGVYVALMGTCPQSVLGRDISCHRVTCVLLRAAPIGGSQRPIPSAWCEQCFVNRALGRGPGLPQGEARAAEGGTCSCPAAGGAGGHAGWGAGWDAPGMKCLCHL